MTVSQSFQQHIFIQSTTSIPGVQQGAHTWCNESKQPDLYGINSDISTTGAQLKVACIQRWLPAYPPAAGFQVPSSQQNDIRTVQVATMVKDTKHKSSSKQANVTPPILNSSVVLTDSNTCYENLCLIIHLKIHIVSISALCILLSLYLQCILIEKSLTVSQDSWNLEYTPTKQIATGLTVTVLM